MTPRVFRRSGFAIRRPSSSPLHCGLAMCAAERQVAWIVIAPTNIRWVAPMAPMHVDASARTQTHRHGWCAVVCGQLSGPSSRGHAPRRGELQRGIIAFGDARMETSPVMSQDKHQESRTQGADALMLHRVWAKDMFGFRPRRKADEFARDRWRVPMWHAPKEICQGVKPGHQRDSHFSVRS